MKEIIYKNDLYLTWLYQKIENGYRPELTIEETLSLVNKIAKFYEFIYPDAYINDLYINNKFGKIKNISQYDDTDNLKQIRYRLNYRELMVIDCEFRNHLIKMQNKETSYTLLVDSNGYCYGLGLKYIPGLENLDKVYITDVYKTLMANNSNVYELIRVLYDHQVDIELRTKLFELVLLAIERNSNSYEQASYRIEKFKNDIMNTYGIEIDLESMINKYTDIIKDMKLFRLRKKIERC